MNARRAKQKKMYFEPQTQEQLAKEKLFEISNLCEDKFIDESHILAIDREKGTPFESNQLTLIIKNMEAVKKKKSKSFNLKEYRTLADDEPSFKASKEIQEPQFCILNALKSQQVFVGNKLKRNQEEYKNKIKQFMSEESVRRKKRMQTMPVIEQHSYRQVKPNKRGHRDDRPELMKLGLYRLFPQTSLINKEQSFWVKDKAMHDVLCKDSFFRLNRQTRRQYLQQLPQQRSARSYKHAKTTKK